jgi:hypothetical protein
MFEMISPVSGGGQHVQGAAVDGVRLFETLFVNGSINRNLVVEMSETCPPNLKSRLKALTEQKIKPGHQE